MNKFKHNAYQTFGKPIPKITNLKTKTNSDDEDDDDLFSFRKSNQLGYFTQQKVSTNIVVPIDESIKGAEYYRQVTNAIANTSADDNIQFEINSPGGNLSGLLALLTAMAKTEATSIAHINAECHSAASMLALNCDSIYVSPYASMLVHFVTFGTYGKATDIKSHVNHVHSTTEQLFRETYELFLSEEEIEKCINGFELWLDYDEISKRLEYKYETLAKMQEDVEKLEQQLDEKLEEEQVEDTPKPKRTRKAKTE